MNGKRTLLTVVAAAALAAVGMYPVSRTDWFSQTFSGLADGMAFTGAPGQGEKGGSWDPIPSGVATVATVNGRKGIRVDTSSCTNAIRFVATNALANAVHVDFAVASEPTPWIPAVVPDDKVALSFASDDNGMMTFFGYTAEGWVKLSCQGFVQRREDWIDGRAEVECRPTGTNVTYYVSSGGRAYQPLADGEGRSSFPIAGNGMFNAVAFDGTGAVGDFAGFGVARDDSRVYTWKGPTGGDIRWENPENWLDYLGENRVPGNGDLAQVSSQSIRFGKYLISVFGDGTLSIVSNECVCIGSGEVAIECDDGDYTSLGTVSAEKDAALRATGEYRSIEMTVGSTIVLNASKGLRIIDKPFFLDGVNLRVSNPEDALLVSAPYGSGGVPASVNLIESAWLVDWHGRLDGTMALWLASRDSGSVAVWKDGVWGNLVYKQNWVGTPGPGVAARIGNGQAHMSSGDTFEFARTFCIGQAGSGEVDMSGGAVVGNPDGAVVVGAGGGTGLLDIVGGSVRSCDYLWNYALTLGSGTNSTGAVRVRGGTVDASGGSVSIGANNASSLEIEKGLVSVGDALGVGYSASLGVTGGMLAVSNSLYVGRSERGDAYDVSMTVSDGVVSNVAAGAVWIGSYGGVGSKASLAVEGGMVYATNMFVCGGYRSAEVSVCGGVLVASEIRLAHDLIDEEDVATFSLVSGRVETAGFTSGTNGVRMVTLAGGKLVATAANDDFFAGIETVRLEGDAEVSNDDDIAITSAMAGPGGFVKAGAGMLRVAGYAAWNGKTIVEDGVLDMDDGIVMGELAIKGSGQVVNAKYDNLDALSFSAVPWQNGTASTSLYVRIQFSVDNGSERIATVVDANGVTKGAFKRTDGGFAGWTALGWVDLCHADGAGIAADGDVRMTFDFRGSKFYIVYQAFRNGAWERLVSTDGLNMFPVPGGAANVKDFTGDMVLGEQLMVLPGTVFYWIGGDGAWTDGANWSGGTCPTKTATAFIEKPVSVSLDGPCDVAALVVNATVTFANGGENAELRVWREASGVGKISLAGASVCAVGNDVVIRPPVDVLSGFDNELEGDGLIVAGPVMGSGTLLAKAKFYGDMSAFAGTVKLLDGGIFSSEASNSERSSWEVSGFPFAIGDHEYAFGALGGSFSASEDDAKGVALVVGERDEDCRLQGEWRVGSGSGFDWAAKTAVMTYAVANSDFIRLSGGGRLVLALTNEVEAVAGVVSFVGKGGVLSFAEGIDLDISGVIADSTAPVAFDDGGIDRVWSAALASSNVGGFVKRGKGTLTLKEVPAYAGETVVEEGTLVVPFGTQLSSVRIAYGAHLVVDMNGATDGIAFAAASANRALKMPYFSVTNSAVEFSAEVGKNNGMILYVGSETFVWTGASDRRWKNVGNWNMSDGQPAERLPDEQDVVLFENAAAVELGPNEVAVRRIEGFGDLRILGGSMSVVGAFELSSHRLTLDDNVVFDVAEASIRTLAGTGTVSVAKGLGVLAVAPEEGVSDVFAGTLNVTNFTKNGQGSFAYEPRSAFVGTLSVGEGVMLLDCRGSMTNQPSADVTMKAGATLDLCGHSVVVRSFVGAGTVMNGFLTTADGVITQKDGDLSIPATSRTTYVLSRAGEHLKVMDAAGKDISIVVPKTWYVAGVTGRRVVWCENKDVIWNPDPECARVFKAIDEGDGWWSIAGGGFAIRLR